MAKTRKEVREEMKIEEREVYRRRMSFIGKAELNGFTITQAEFLYYYLLNKET